MLAIVEPNGLTFLEETLSLDKKKFVFLVQVFLIFDFLKITRVTHASV